MAGNKNWKKWNMIVIWCIILIGNHEAESRTKKPKCSVCEAIRDKFLEVRDNLWREYNDQVVRHF